MLRRHVLLIALIIGHVGCSLVDEELPGDFETRTIEHVTEFDTAGVYFYYRADEGSQPAAARLEEARDLLQQVSRSRPFRAAYFRRPSYGCKLPGGAVLRMVVPAQLLIQFPSSPATGPLPDAFRRAAVPGLICPYSVVEFRPRYR